MSKSKSPPVLSDYLTKEQLAKELGKCARTIDRWTAIGEGPPQTRFGREIRYRRASIMAWLEKREQRMDT
jgi:predicted DNA-binding transcriptional regulator AlpA